MFDPELEMARTERELFARIAVRHSSEQCGEAFNDIDVMLASALACAGPIPATGEVTQWLANILPPQKGAT